jgi:hypothetical protein
MYISYIYHRYTYVYMYIYIECAKNPTRSRHPMELARSRSSVHVRLSYPSSPVPPLENPQNGSVIPRVTVWIVVNN